jgi:DNA-binding XRE family transcriptional regulator
MDKEFIDAITGRHIHAARILAGMSRHELAEKSHLTYLSVSLIENGKRNPREGTKILLLQAIREKKADIFIENGAVYVTI